MTRQITFYKYVVGYRSLEQIGETDTYKLTTHDVCEVEATSLTKSDIRRAIIESGVDCPRGTDVYATRVGKVLYKFTTEKLLAAADSREELPFD